MHQSHHRAWHNDVPCIRAPSSDPSRRARWSSRRSTSRRQQPRPKSHCQHHLTNTLPIDRRAQNRGCTYNSEVLERPGRLNVLQGRGEVLELQVDGLLGSLGILDGLHLEGVDGLDLAADIVGVGLELLESLLNLINDGAVLEHGAVGGEVDGRGLLRQLLNLAARVLVALLEGLQGGDGLAAEAQRAGDLGPVELQGGASLREGREKISSSDRVNWRAIATLRVAEEIPCCFNS